MTGLNSELSQIIIGGGVFNTQMNEDPLALPIPQIIRKAFDAGINAIDTSPYYGPSEELVGKALRDPIITEQYKRSDYLIITKAGRVNLDTFDYSAGNINKSVDRSLERMDTNYLDVVFCHDVEFVTDEELYEAFGQLQKLQNNGTIRYIGISSYHPQVISRLVPKLVEKCGKAPDVIQNYAHFTIQNTTMLDHSSQWLSHGVNCVLNSSPLNMGLLSGKPAADFHPAPKSLRDTVMDVAEYCVEVEKMPLPEVALKFVIGKSQQFKHLTGGGFIINGISYVEELEKLLAVVEEFSTSGGGGETRAKVKNDMQFDMEKVQNLEPLFDRVRSKFGDSIDVEWESPPPGFIRK